MSDQSEKKKLKEDFNSPTNGSFPETMEPGEGQSTKRSQYEPQPIERCKQVVCSQSRAIIIATTTAAVIISIALIAALARPPTPPCLKETAGQLKETASTSAPSLTTKPAPTKSEHPIPYNNIRLPDTLKPLSYNILMHPNLTDLNFSGRNEIKIQVSKETDFIVIHSKELNITKRTIVTIGGASNKGVQILNSIPCTEHEQYYMKLSRKLNVGEIVLLTLEFNANLASNMAGFYKSSYRKKSGEQRYLATTHFEPTDARKAFPCFDEPALKVEVTMSIVREKPYIALFNMPLKTTEDYTNGYLVDRFETTVLMSTYLVAFVVCDYDHIEKNTSRNIKVSVYTPPEQIGQAKFALEAAVNILDYYEKFFGLQYPLPKQDLIAIPDFAAGAMENWGLITYRLTAILYDPKVSSSHDQQWVGIVIAHELAHQWFGNLVTMKWWNDLWLNEGFASYVEYIGTNHFKSEWKMFDQSLGMLRGALGVDSLMYSHPVSFDRTRPLTEMFDGISYDKIEQFVVDTSQAGLNLDSLSHSHPISVPVHEPNQINEIFDSISYKKNEQFVVDTLQRGLNLDGLSNSHPISVAVHEPSQIDEIFDNISYEKGASIIRMAQYFLGSEDLHKGLKDYLVKYKYKNAETKDLWDALSKASKKKLNVSKIMDTWTLQMGYPVVTLKRDGKIIKATQERFLLNPDAEPSKEFTSPYKYTWQIPLTYITDGGKEEQIWMKQGPGRFGLPATWNWYKANVRQTGFYRVNYEKENWDALKDQLMKNHTVLPSSDRAGLIDDAFALARANRLSFITALELTKYLEKEEDYVPWQSALSCLQYLKKVLEGTEGYNHYVNYLLKLIGPQAKKIGWQDTGSNLHKFLRSLILRLAVRHEDPDATTNGVKLFNDWMTTGKSIPPNLKATVYRAGVQNGGKKEWDFCWKQLNATNVASEKSKLRLALSTTKNIDLLSKLLRWSIDPTKFKLQDTVFVIVSVAINSPSGRILAWEFVKDNWDSLNKSLNEHDISRIILRVPAHFTTKYRLNEVRDFLQNHTHNSRASKQALETIQASIKWLDTHQKEVVDWLEKNSQ